MPGTMRGGREDSQRWCFPPSPARRPARRRRRNPRASQSPGRIRLRRAKTRPARRRRVWLAAAPRILRGADHAEAVADALQHATREGSQGMSRMPCPAKDVRSTEIAAADRPLLGESLVSRAGQGRGDIANYLRAKRLNRPL